MTDMPRKKVVTIVQRILPHYRHAFFVRLHERLAQKKIELRLVYGQAIPGTVPLTTVLERPWAIQIRNAYLFRGKILWQPCLKDLMSSDLIVVEQASRNIVNYLLAVLSAFGICGKIGLWGHGRNMQGRERAVSEKIKSFMARRADWWFAYTRQSFDVFASHKIDISRISVVNNSIDTDMLKRALESVSSSQLAEVRRNCEIRSSNIGLYVGGMYPDKKLKFLVGACEEIRRKCRDFELILIGSGPDQGIVETAANTHSWIHYVGPVTGEGVAKYYKQAKLLLMPGLVGLVIVDSFVAGLPIVTTDIPIHSPEISYLSNWENGVMCEHSVVAYSDVVSELLTNEIKRRALVNGCEMSAQLYTLDNMVSRFCEGVENCVGVA